MHRTEGAKSVSNDRIAVVIPVYNGSKYLAEAIESVLNQTLAADDILVIDDGSTDDSAEIARSYSRVRVIVQSNSGVSASRNLGVSRTTATWIAFLDQDDVWEPVKLESQLAALKSNPGADVCLCGQRMLIQLGDPSTYYLTDPVPRPPSEKVGRALYWSFRFPPSCVMLRREPFLAVGGFDGSSTPCEDWDLWLRLEQAGAKFVCSPEIGLQYRVHDSNVSNDSRKMYRGGLRAYDLRIAPTLPWIVAVVGRQFMKSKFLGEVAIVEREQNRPHIGIMLSSIAGFPFGDWRRYKIVAHSIIGLAKRKMGAA